MQNMNRRNIVLALSFLFILPAAFGQQSKAAAIDSVIQRAYRLGVFNGNVLVKDNNRTVYHTAIGQADATGSQPLTEQHRFHIGSIAKEFSAAGIMLLQQEGRLSLHDHVSKYLPNLPSWADSIEIIHLLQYTSGLPDVKWKTVNTDADNMADLQQLTRLNTVPGQTYAYNNNNIFLQRQIIEKVSGRSFKDFVTQRLLLPAGMKTAIVDPTETTPLMSKSFSNDKKQDPLTIPISGQTAVTLQDLYLWSEAINHFKILHPASTRTILYPFAPNRQAGLGGGGMEGNKMIRHVHDGTGRNFQALLVSDPVKGRTVILLTNNMQNNLYDFNTAIQNILDGKPYTQPKKAGFNLLLANIKDQKGEQLLTLYNQLKQQYSEQYDFDGEGTLNRLGYHLMGQGRIDDAIIVFEYNTTLFPQSGNVFDSLGEAYYKKGDKARALVNYKRSLELDPGNETAKMIIAELTAK
ncbi:serine hydrolase [Chitinophaga agri]|uniref:Serine hydrolase n=2 Tax=Chitinophaga agri TaxID=2703787 RepID=A0A6B9Z8J8_9BACT|nr:serine hydrolase [Chitinophaga agri]